MYKQIRFGGMISLLVIGLALAFVLAPTGTAWAQTPPPPTPICTWPDHKSWGHCCPEGQDWKGDSAGCRPPECPSSLPVDAGNPPVGADCHPLYSIVPPVPTGQDSVSGMNDDGQVVMLLPPTGGGAVGWNGRGLSVSAGCLELERSPFPRGLVNFPADKDQLPPNILGTKFQLREKNPTGDPFLAPWIVPPATLATYGMAPWISGGYLPASSAPHLPPGDSKDMVRGLSLNGFDVASGFDTRNLLAALGVLPVDRYPSLQNVVAYLVFVRNTEATAQWSIDGINGNRNGSTAYFRFPFASYPASYPVGYLPLSAYSSDGLDMNLQPTLPAFRLRAQAKWTLHYMVKWDIYGVVDHRYSFIKSSGWSDIPFANTFTVSRVWGGGYLDTGNPLSYVRQPAGASRVCNMASYVPVPVIEAQAVLVK